MSLTSQTLLQLASAILFVSFAGLTLGGAVVAAGARRLVYAVSGLAVCFAGIGGLYYFLHSPFLTLMQILIYVGAVCITIMFALMLADPNEAPSPLARKALIGAASFATAAVLAAVLITLIRRSDWMPAAKQLNTGTVADLGHALLGRFGFAFELISVVLLLAILGAVVVARSGRGMKR